jgi:hypothetical protein
MQEMCQCVFDAVSGKTLPPVCRFAASPLKRLAFAHLALAHLAFVRFAYVRFAFARHSKFRHQRTCVTEACSA